MVTKLAPLFSKGTDDWSTPDELFAALDAEFNFDIDAAATYESRKLGGYFGPDHPSAGLRDALAVEWDQGNPYGFGQIPSRVFLNPPYSRVRDFIAKAAEQARKGNATVVCLVPARTDTRWFHDHIWDEQWHRTRPGVEVRFIKGRVKFGAATNGAPFPSMVVIFRRWA
jgi:phage N-6-adenine-methyltransferase